jgi:uncharacterized protein YbjT (DUF2867 family)
MNLILGASGTVGSRVGRSLLNRGEPVRVVSRSPSRLAELVRLGAEPVQGDLRTAGWMSAALEGVRSLVLSTHGLVPPTRDNHPGITDDKGNRAVMDAARRAGVEHVLFVSAMSGANPSSLFGQVKYRAEEYLKDSGLTYTIIRPTVFIETHAVRLLAEPLRESGSVRFFGPGTTVLNWISAEDVAAYIVRALHTAQLRNCTASIGGPDDLCRLEVLATIEQTLGRTARRTHVPVTVLRAMRLLAGPFHPGIRYLLDMALAESTMPDDPSWVPRALDWTGPTTVLQVVQRWAAPDVGSVC